jgi:hypothetical protein
MLRHPCCMLRHPCCMLRHPSSVIRAACSVIRHPSSVLHAPSSVLHAPSSVIRHPSSVLHAPSSVLRAYKTGNCRCSDTTTCMYGDLQTSHVYTPTDLEALHYFDTASLCMCEYTHAQNIYRQKLLPANIFEHIHMYTYTAQHKQTQTASVF